MDGVIQVYMLSNPLPLCGEYVNTQYKTFPDGYQALYLEDFDGELVAQANKTIEIINHHLLYDPSSFMDCVATHNPYMINFSDIDASCIRVRSTSRKLHCTVSSRPGNTTIILDKLMIYPSDPVKLDDGSTRIGWITIRAYGDIDVPCGYPHVTIGYLVDLR